MAQQVDIADFYAGERKSYKFEFQEDVTNWTIWLTIKAKASDADVDALLQVYSTAGDDVRDDAINGTMYVVAPSDLTVNIPPGKHVYGFQRVIEGTNPPDVRVLKAGKVKVLDKITDTVVKP